MDGQRDEVAGLRCARLPRVSAGVGELRQEHARLWRKRERYRSSGANLDSIGRQIARVENRMADKIRELVSNDKQASEYLRRELEAARQARYSIGRA